MSKVVQLNAPSQHQREADRHAALLRSFAQHRRFGDDVFWLKENAELLNILECTGAQLDEHALDAHRGFYAQVEKRLGFFPQYYRFLLSICLDLEDLGMDGNKGEVLVKWVADQGLAEMEMSDLQRGEARRLMLRRGCDPLPMDAGLDDRMRRFVDRSATFAMPNKKAAYELTHTIFYLSEYGRKNPNLGHGAAKSLDFAGTLAFLDQNADLLAEICVAMRFAGLTPPNIWENWLAQETHRFFVDAGPECSPHDDYHEFFVCNWQMSVSGRDAFAKRFEPGRMSFTRATNHVGPLREMSECMFRLDEDRCDDWGQMRGHVEENLNEETQSVLELAEAASHSFDAFFAGFSRVGLRGVAL